MTNLEKLPRRVVCSLHRKLQPELRAKIDEALRSQRPGMESVDRVYEAFDLKAHGIHVGALRRYAKRLRAIDAAQGKVAP